MTGGNGEELPTNGVKLKLALIFRECSKFFKLQKMGKLKQMKGILRWAKHDHSRAKWHAVTALA